jgi:hypothetical protein
MSSDEAPEASLEDLRVATSMFCGFELACAFVRCGVRNGKCEIQQNFTISVKLHRVAGSSQANWRRLQARQLLLLYG